MISSPNAAFLGTCLLFLVAPFERLRPMVSLPGQHITTVEAAMILAIAAWLAAVIVLRDGPMWRTAVTLPWAGWLGIAWVAAAMAPSFRINALKVVARLTAGLIVFLLPVNGITSPRRLAQAGWLAAASAVTVAVLATMEFANVPFVTHWLDGFRQGTHVVGGKVRASGTLQYPTIASMYLEIIFALTLGVFLAAVDRRARAVAAGLFCMLVVIGEGIVVTLTRAGLISIVVCLIVAAALRYVRLGLDGGIKAIAALAIVIGVLAVTSTSAESLRLRMTTDGHTGWYRAGFLTPGTFTFAPSSVNVVEIEVINRGSVTWDPEAEPSFHVSYHWYDDAMHGVVSYDGLRTPFPRAVVPGESIRMLVQVRAPKDAGPYRLGWDVVQEGRLWFSEEPGARLAVSTVTVSGTASAAVVPTTGLPVQTVRIGRRALWAAALRMARDHPVLGIGPDNFRLTYGPYAGLTQADSRITSNNTYLEILTGTGLVGAAAFGWFMWRARTALQRTVRRLPLVASSLYSGVVAAVAAIGTHGLLDSFLTLTPTYLVMSLTLGLAMAPAGWTDDAHRV